ncbi:MAG TPA: SUMF1/EgtB/PvdO family nonheme iron enzyme [Polyangia bacterium]|jgi:formylglycine-generating enzyme required for sulfatase activity
MDPKEMRTRGLLLALAVTGLGAVTAAVTLSRHPAEAAAVVPHVIAAPACVDEDGDGFGLNCPAGPDCNDRDATVHPGRREACNFRDDDCNGLVDDDPACPAPALDPTRVTVPAGRLLMGSDGGAPDERPVHAVAIGAFAMDRYEVTNRRYEACVAAGRCAAPRLLSSHLRAHYLDDRTFADYPVVFVDFDQASEFCEHAGGRLPTEAEWELAARGTKDARTYPWGDDPPDCSRANLGGPGGCANDTDRVGRRPAGASPYGAQDMAGNVWEWTADWYDARYYERSPGRDPRGPAEGTLKVVRGGCWQSGADSLRSTCRKAELPATWAYNVGFRCVYPGAKGGRRD